MAFLKMRQVAYILFPRFSKTIEAVNWNGAFKQWLDRHHPKLWFKTREEMFKFLNCDVLGNQPITYLEFGVHTGRSIEQWTKLNTSPESRFVGFDSFKGLPTDWYREFKQGHFDTGGIVPQIQDARVSFVKGWFQETLPDFAKNLHVQNRFVIHNDSDLYTSTLFCLTVMDRLMRSGTIIIFDDFCVAEHEFRAFMDYTSSYRRDYQCLAGAGEPYIQKIAVMME